MVVVGGTLWRWWWEVPCGGGGGRYPVEVRWPGRSRSRAMSFERFRRCAQDTKAVKLRAMTHLALRP